MSSLQMTELRAGSALIIEVSGSIDSTNASTFKSNLWQVLSRPEACLIIDLEKLEFMSSAGFRIFLLLAREADSSNVRLGLCGLHGRVRSLFELGGFLELLPIFASRSDALAKLGA